MLPIPKKLLKEGVRDMVRISDARMSGTGYGTCVLHVAPESFAGGPLALVRDGDLIALDVPARRLACRRRQTSWRGGGPPGRGRRPTTPRLRGALPEHVIPADEGCDFDFLAPAGESRSQRSTEATSGMTSRGDSDLIERFGRCSTATLSTVLNKRGLNRVFHLRRRCRCPARGRGSPGAPSPCARSPCARTSSRPTRRSTRG